MLLLGLAFALPAFGLPSPAIDNGSASAGHLRYNVCEPGAMPILYKEYHADMCPPAYTMNEAGICLNQDGHNAGLGSGDGECDPRYCEVRQKFRRHQEVPIPNGDCRWPGTCTFHVTNGGTFRMRPQVDPMWNKALSQGVTGGYSYAPSIISSNLVFTITPKYRECGYLTFLPIVHESCGTMSQGRWRKDGFWPAHVDCTIYKSIGNMCTTQPYRNKDGDYVNGDFVFVRLNCTDGKLFPMDQQPPAYRHDGVALPQSVPFAVVDEAHTISAETIPPISAQKVKLGGSDAEINTLEFIGDPTNDEEQRASSEGISSEL